MSTHIADHAGTRPNALPVTRVEIIDHLGSAFTGAWVPKTELLAQAERGGARPEVLDVLGDLPDGSFNRPQDLWPELPEVPIEN